MAERKNEMKKQYILYILKILKEYTDEFHPMDLQELKKILSEKPYEVEIDRRAIWSTIDDLIALEYPIEIINTNKNDVEVIRNGEPLRQRVYYNYNSSDNTDLTDSEIWLLIDTILASSHIQSSHANQIVDWLMNQASISFRDMYGNVKSSDYGYHTKQGEIFITIENIDSAVRNDNQMSFKYNDFNEKGTLTVKKEYVVVSPYFTVMRNGHYYLICCRDGENEFYHYRVDKISNSKSLKGTERTPLENIKADFNLNDYIQEHPYMFAGDVSNVRFLIDKRRIGALYDYFGNKATITSKAGDEDRFEVSMKTNINGFYYWALQYGESVEILEPQELRDKMRQAVKRMAKTYSITDDDVYSEAIEESRVIHSNNVFESFSVLDLRGINLQNKRKHNDIDDVVFLAVGYNGISSYEFIKRYKKLNTLKVSEPAILNDLQLSMPSLGFLEISEATSPYSEEYDSVPALKNFNSISGCKNIIYICIESGKIDSFEGIYDLPNLEELVIPKEYFKLIDISRFSSKPKVKKGDICRISFPETINHHKDKTKKKKRKKKERK